MKIYRYLLLLLIPTLIALASCGGSDDNDDSGSNEEATTGTTGATSASSSTSGTTTGDGGNTCLTSNQRTRIINLYNRGVSQSPIIGTAEESAADEAFVYDFASITVRNQGNNTWIAETRTCIGDECSTQTAVHSVAGQCFTIDGFQVRITSSTSSSLTGRYTDTTTQPQASYRFEYIVPSNGRTFVTTRTFLNGEFYGIFEFREDAPDTTTSSSAVSEAAASESAVSEATASDGSTTGDTGTTGGFSAAMGFGL